MKSKISRKKIDFFVVILLLAAAGAAALVFRLKALTGGILFTMLPTVYCIRPNTPRLASGMKAES